MSNNFFIYIISFLILLLTSCIQNQIFLENNSKDIYNKYTDGVNLVIEDFPKKLGYQYLFYFFPFGVNKLKNTNTELSKFLEIELNSKGLHIDSKSEKVIYLKIHKLNTSVYDYIVTRKLSCSADVSLSFYNNGQLIKNLMSESNYSSYEKFAFVPKMTFCLQEALLEAFKDGIKDVSFKH